MITLFKHYPELKDSLPHISLGELPTPVERLAELGKSLGLHHLYIKRDDLSGRVYGGNKVRKLEFLLGRALQMKVKEVLTFGYAGSNHAVATALYANQVGLRTINMLLRQPNAHYVRKNLLMGQICNAELHQYPNVRSLKIATVYQLLRHKLEQGRFPQMIAPGGSSPVGSVGYVNAAFELKEQIEEGKTPPPDQIYVALGTGGTVVGLMLGLKATNVNSHIVAVRVTDERFGNMRRIGRLFHDTNSLLCSIDSSFRMFEFTDEDIQIRHDFFGPGYAHFTEEGMRAVDLLRDSEGIELEGTYTGKTFAALVHDARKGQLKDKTVLFWNTYNSRDYSDRTKAVEYQSLPQCFYCYFEEDVQDLDSS